MTKVLLFLLALNVPAWGEELTLFYNQPATDWQSQALPIGNGRLGAMIFGDPQHEHIQVNESSLWTGDEKNMGSYQNLGDLTFDLEHGPGTDYRRSLDLTTAMHRIIYKADGVFYSRDYFASAPKHALVFHYEADKPGAYSGVIRFADAHNAVVALEDNKLTIRGKLDNDLVYETQVVVLTTGGEIKPESSGVRLDALRVSKADSVTILVLAGTNYAPDRSRKWRGADPHEQIQQDLAAVLELADYRKVKFEHIADYKDLFFTVMLKLGKTPEEILPLPTDQRLVKYAAGGADPELEATFFQYGRYLLISSSRPGGLPANLQGLWNNSNSPPWRSDYHSNINIEMNYWPAEVTALSRCAEPFFDYVNSLRGVRTEATHEYYLHEVDPGKVERKPVRGWTVQTENNIFGAGGFKWNPPGSAWYALHFWEHYAFTLDRKFLFDEAYPVLKEVTQFWEDHLVEMPDGELATPDGWSPEHGPEEKGVSYDQEIVWELFTDYIEASQVLGVDPMYREKITHLRDRLVTPKIGKWGQLQEWMEDRDDPKDDHRHVSHLFGLFPGREISPLTTPELADAAQISLAARGDKSTGWAMAWRIAFWARLWDGDHAYRLLRNLMHITGKGDKIDYGKGGGVYSNLFDAHPPFQIDGNFGATAGMAEMLMQSHLGEIDVLPALPKAWADEGFVSGLRARGNIKVTISWKDGKVRVVTLQSPEERDIKVRWGEKSKMVHIAPRLTSTVSFD